MPDTDTPKDGDFAAQLERAAARKPAIPPATPPAAAPADATKLQEVMQQRGQTIEDILMGGEEPTEAFLTNMREADAALGEMSDEEFERQALEAGGDDGDPNTPE